MVNKKVIIVFNDSDPVLARVSRVKFRQAAGWEVEITTSFQDALNAIKKMNPNLLITEVIISDERGRDGFDLITAARELRHEDDLTIAILSSSGQIEDKDRAKECGVDYYYVKSEISINNLIKELQQVLSKRVKVSV